MGHVRNVWILQNGNLTYLDLDPAGTIWAENYDRCACCAHRCSAGSLAGGLAPAGVPLMLQLPVWVTLRSTAMKRKLHVWLNARVSLASTPELCAQVENVKYLNYSPGQKKCYVGWRPGTRIINWILNNYENVVSARLPANFELIN